jgi:hypothetical protein
LLALSFSKYPIQDMDHGPYFTSPYSLSVSWEGIDVPGSEVPEVPEDNH